MTKTAMIRARTTPAVKADTERIFQRLGISTSEAINLFLAQVKMRKGLPFDVRIPNKATLKAMKDADEGKNLTTYDSVDDFFKKDGRIVLNVKTTNKFEKDFELMLRQGKDIEKLKIIMRMLARGKP